MTTAPTSTASVLSLYQDAETLNGFARSYLAKAVALDKEGRTETAGRLFRLVEELTAEVAALVHAAEFERALLAPEVDR